MLSCFVRIYKQMCCTRAFLMLPRTAQKFEDIFLEMVHFLSKPLGAVLCICFFGHLGEGEEILSFTLLLWPFLQICAQPSRVKCCCRCCVQGCFVAMSTVHVICLHLIWQNIS